MGYSSMAGVAFKDAQSLAQYPGANGDQGTAVALIHTAVATLFLDHRVTVSSMILQPSFPNGNWSFMESHLWATSKRQPAENYSSWRPFDYLPG